MGGKRIFVSYTSADRTWAEWIAWIAEAGGHTVALQAWDFGPGRDFVQQMHEAARDCDTTVAVLSPEYLDSKFAEAEWRVAFARDPSGVEHRLIPVRVKECNPEGLLETRVYLDLVGRERDGAGRLLLSALRGERGKPTVPPEFPPDEKLRAFPGRADALETYRRWALDRYGHLELVGLGAGDFHFDLDEVYVPLGMAARGLRLEERSPRRIDELHHETRDEITLDEAFALADRLDKNLAIFGEAGAGKTTALRKLLHQVLTAGAISLGLAAPTLPVFLRLRRLTPAHLDGTMAAFIQRELDELAPGRFPETFTAELWARGDLLLLLDGLDEIANDAQRAAVCRFVEGQITGERDRGIRAVVSSRFSGYGDDVNLGGRFLPLDVRKLDDDRIALLVHSWFRAARRAMDPRPERWAKADTTAREDADALVATLRTRDYSSRQILELVSSPLLLTLLCIVVLRGGDIPRRRTEFYRECLRILLGRWSSSKGIRPLLDVEDALDVLAGVAFAMHDQGRRDDLTQDEFGAMVGKPVARIARKLDRDLTPEAMLRWLHRGAGVLAEYGPNRYGFSHLGLQEYLAATQVAKEGGDRMRDVARKFGDDWWREVTLLLLGLPGYRVFAPFMQEVAAHADVVAYLDHLRQCLDDAHAIDPAPFVEVIGAETTDTARRTTLLRAFLGRNEPDVAAAAVACLADPDDDLRAVAHSLAEAAGIEVPTAPRVEPIGDSWTEPTTGLRFLAVPGGTFEMGATDLWEACAPPHTVHVSPFLLAETPVSNRQYGRFLEDRDHPEPIYWRDNRFAAPDQPVVGVSWHDAVAFCRWLSERSGRECHLPSEAQWERAARDDDGRPYPWGSEDPASTRAVFGLDWEKGKPAPVGSVPGGKGPYGHLDLAGNVWEWCADVWDEKAYEKRAGTEVRDPVNEGGDTSVRALRGGSWGLGAECLRSAYRLRYDADGRDGVIGFRVAVSAASTVDR